MLNKAIDHFVENVVDSDVKARTALDLPQIEIWQSVPDDQTPEEKAAQIAAEQAKVAEALKKNKKKPKTADEDAQDKENLLQKMTHSLSTHFTEEIDRCESEIELSKTEWLMQNHLRMDADAFEKLNRKISILDIDISELDVVLRMDLDMPLSAYSPLPPLEDEFKELLEMQAQEASNPNLKKKQKKTKK